MAVPRLMALVGIFIMGEVVQYHRTKKTRRTKARKGTKYLTLDGILLKEIYLHVLKRIQGQISPTIRPGTKFLLDLLEGEGISLTSFLITSISQHQKERYELQEGNKALQYPELTPIDDGMTFDDEIAEMQLRDSIEYGHYAIDHIRTLPLRYGDGCFGSITSEGDCAVCHRPLPVWRDCEACLVNWLGGNTEDVYPDAWGCRNPQHQRDLNNWTTCRKCREQPAIIISRDEPWDDEYTEWRRSAWDDSPRVWGKNVLPPYSKGQCEKCKWPLPLWRSCFQCMTAIANGDLDVKQVVERCKDQAHRRELCEEILCNHCRGLLPLAVDLRQEYAQEDQDAETKG